MATTKKTQKKSVKLRDMKPVKETKGGVARKTRGSTDTVAPGGGRWGPHI